MLAASNSNTKPRKPSLESAGSSEQDAHSQRRGEDLAGAGHCRLPGSEPLGASKSLRSLHQRLDQRLTGLQQWVRDNSVEVFSRRSTKPTTPVAAALGVLAGLFGVWLGLTVVLYCLLAVAVVAGPLLHSNYALYVLVSTPLTVLVILAMVLAGLAGFWGVAYLPLAAVWLLRAALLGAVRALALLLGLLPDSLCVVSAKLRRPGSLSRAGADGTGCVAASADPAVLLQGGASASTLPPASPQAADPTDAPVVVQLLGSNNSPSTWCGLWGAWVADSRAASCGMVGHALKACSGGPCTRPMATARCKLDQQLARAQQWAWLHLTMGWAAKVPGRAGALLLLSIGAGAMCSGAASDSADAAMSSRHGWFDTVPGQSFKITLNLVILVPGMLLGAVVFQLSPTAAVVLLRGVAWAAWLVAALLVGLPADGVLAGCTALGRAVGSAAAGAPVSAHSLLQPDGCSSSTAAAVCDARPDAPLTSSADEGMELTSLVKPPAGP